MPSDRLRIALRELPSSDWNYFERFTSEYLVVEFPNLRTMASQSGDKGRDAQLFEFEDVPKTVFQYSLSADWSTKIRSTKKRLMETLPHVTRVIYCTNRAIGPDADRLLAMGSR